MIRRGKGKLACLLLALAMAGLAASAGAQGVPGDAANRPALPSAPGSGEQATVSGPVRPSQALPATISGTVIAANGAELAGARVALTGTVNRTLPTGSNGEFTFSGLPAGVFSVTVSAPGMKVASVRGIVVQPGAIQFLPPILLSIAGASTSVEVYAQPEMLAEVQLQIELHQRVLGILPNYYSSYNWHAEHLWPKQKFQLGFRSEIDPVTLTIIGAEAGIEQYYNRFPSFGQDEGGYAKRYGAAYATDFTGTMIADAALPSLFHQDPRYFYKGTGSFRSRALYAISRTLICRGDNGRNQFDYSRVLGDFAAGGISNLYYPAADRGTSLVFTNGAIDLAANSATNLIREFILPGLSSNGPGQKERKIKIHFFPF